ncbi:YfhO family protein [Oribacterium sp. P6A1]|uniref:YfhO family protein n=1 Tax=Oribacterium sp. P6A1 TaxID=1410612 RepID=UPI00068E9B6B|nr:YfhO family protein [Oribacterium sp. P6A1]
MFLRYLKRHKSYLVSFMFPVLGMLLIFVFRGIYPFGTETFLRTDMYHQYAPFSSEFNHKLQNAGSLLYTWDVGLGINFTALYAYYLASPLNWLMILCPKGLILEFMTYSIVLKIGLCGVSMCYYLRHHFPLKSFGCAFFAMAYAMSGYISAYSWNLMWLDCIILFPLIMLGLERLVQGKSGMLYVISLGLSILSNYYISIMICIFMIVYFICLNVCYGTSKIVVNPHETGISEDYYEDNGAYGFECLMVRALRFGVYSLIAGGLAAVTLLPEIFALQLTASGDINFPHVVQQYFTIIDMFARQMPLVETEQGLDHWPNIYAGAMIFILLPLYFMNRRIRMKEKTINGVLLIFFFLSFSINMLNFIWHGFHYPNSLPCRQSFIYIFIELCMCYEAYIKRNEASVKQVGVSLAAAMGFIILAQKLVTDDAIKWYAFYVTMLFLLIYFLFMYADRVKKLNREFGAICLLFIVFMELTINMAVTSVTITSRTSYTADNADVRNLVKEVREKDDSFYRFEKMTRKTKDDGAWMNFPSVSLFSSTAYSACSDFFREMGMEASTNAYSITGSTPLMNMLFGVKYGIYSQEPAASAETALEFVSESGNTSLFRNRYSLPLGYMFSEQELRNWETDMGTPALAQNSLCEALGAEPVLKNMLGTFEGKKYIFTAGISGEYYAYVNNSSIKEVNVDYGYRSKKTNNVDRGFFIEIGYLEAGEKVTLVNETNEQAMDADIYYFDYSSLAGVYEKLNDESWNLTTWKDTFLSGNITTKEGGIMMTSIPYDEGWSMYVDGEKAELYKVKDTFIGVKLEPGTHTVEMKYFPRGLKAGLLISFLSLLSLIIINFFTGRYGCIERILPVRYEEYDEDELEETGVIEEIEENEEIEEIDAVDEIENL